MVSGSRAKKRRLAEEAPSGGTGGAPESGGAPERSATPSNGANGGNGGDEFLADMTLQTKIEDFKSVLEAPEGGAADAAGVGSGGEEAGAGAGAQTPNRTAALEQIKSLQDELAQLEKGSHARFQRKCQELKHTRRRRELAAQNFRNHQYRNFDQLHDFDVINAAAAYDVGLEQLQDAEVALVDADIRKLEKARDRTEHKAPSGTKRGEGPGAGAPEGKEKEKEKDAGTKSGSPAVPTRESGGSVFLQPRLSEADIRDDLLDIVADLQVQAEARARTAPQERQLICPGRGMLRLDGVLFMPGDLVQATSVLSGEDFDGVVEDIDPVDECVYLTLLCGRRSRLRFRHLRVGRMALRQRAPGITNDDAILRDMTMKQDFFPLPSNGSAASSSAAVPKLSVSVGSTKFLGDNGATAEVGFARR